MSHPESTEAGRAAPSRAGALSESRSPYPASGESDNSLSQAPRAAAPGRPEQGPTLPEGRPL
ncbi:MAG: hypothetical protein JWP52_5 [Rhizobacter sp.]|nr:hypothetical protein [Rhizobacter sp.]